MAKTYKSEALAALHESMSDLHQAGAIDSKTCASSTTHVSPGHGTLSGRHSPHPRQSGGQPAVFAAHLNVTLESSASGSVAKSSHVDQPQNYSPSPPKTASQPSPEPHRSSRREERKIAQGFQPWECIHNRIPARRGARNLMCPLRPVRPGRIRSL